MTVGTEQGTDEQTRRVYGVLATGLGEALGEAREALADHAGLLPDGRLDDFTRLHEEFERRRVRIAFYGEVKAGKSTLINALAARELSPSAFEPMTTIPIRITYGPQTVWRAGERVFDDVEDVARRMRSGEVAVDEIVVETPVDLLQLGGQVDVLDTPGVGSDDRADQISADVLRSLDAVVLVVRYPGLFTKLTRRIMAGLESDIGKLFVVWNLDTDCAELSEEERTRHAEQLRADVAGAHELHLVDAREGLRAQMAGDAKGLVGSGLDRFISALGHFASSDKREVAALREAAKRADQWFAEAEKALAERRDRLRIKLEEVRSRLDDVESGAAAEERAAADQFATFTTALEHAEKDREAGMNRCAAYLRRSIRAARRAWARKGDVEPLSAQLAAAASAYENGVQTVGRDFAMAIARAASEFGSEFVAEVPRRDPLSPAPVAPDERIEKSRQGKGQWLRRLLWRRWYLPGVAAMERDGVDGDLAARKAWSEKVREEATAAMREVLDERRAGIVQRRDAELARIKQETQYETEVVELAALEEHAPAVASRRQSVAEISREAWKLVA